MATFSVLGIGAGGSGWDELHVNQPLLYAQCDLLVLCGMQIIVAATIR